MRKHYYKVKERMDGNGDRCWRFTDGSRQVCEVRYTPEGSVEFEKWSNYGEDVGLAEEMFNVMKEVVDCEREF